MSSISFSDAIAVYGAFAGVAAITTALQAAVALQPLAQLDDVRHRKRDSNPGDARYTNAKDDAKTYFRGAILLSVGAVFVNAAVLTAWGYLVFAVVPTRHLYLELPFVAIGVAALYLIAVAIVGVVGLHDEK
jgi:hypothetical protein